MDKVLPIIIICSVGIAFAIGYIVFVIVNTFRSKYGKRGKQGKRRNEFEIDEDSLTIRLGKKRR